MRIHWLQHVPFEGLGTIELWAKGNGHELSSTRLWAKDKLPEPQDVDLLVVMGGPMGVYDQAAFPWLADEKQFIGEVAETGGGLLGICLGAQLIAELFGAAVYKNEETEIGWYPITISKNVSGELSRILPAQAVVLHWHGDTFDIPAGSKRLFSSVACRNQGFILNGRVIGLQFHLEMTETGLAELIDNCRAELVRGDWVQSEREILENFHELASGNRLLETILDYLQSKIERK